MVRLALIHLRQQALIVGAYYLSIWVLGAQAALHDCQRSMVQWLGVKIAALRFIKPGQVVEADGDIGMIGGQRAFANLQSSVIELLGIGIAALRFIKRSQVVEA